MKTNSNTQKSAPKSSDTDGIFNGDDINHVEIELTKWDWAYIDMCYRVADLSTAKRAQVGSMIAKIDNILSFGYNGMPSKMSNVCEDKNGNTKPEVLHAESNAISKVARSTQSSEGATMYCTYSPCMDCAKLMIQSKISRLIFENVYRDVSGMNLLLRAGISVVMVSRNRRIAMEVKTIYEL